MREVGQHHYRAQGRAAMVAGAGWAALSAVYVFLALISVVPVVMLPMMFDAPGSEENGALIAAALFMATIPISCLLGAILPWIFRKRTFAKKIFLFPIFSFVGTVLAFLAAPSSFGS